MTFELIIAVILAYLLGAIPFGVVVAKVLGGRDPRTAGSKNIGATNVARTLGKKAGAVTLLLDIVKGALPVFLAGAFFKGALPVALVGLAAFLGHLFPVYLKFKGGKGIATAAGVFLAASPLTLLVAALFFALVIWRARMVSLSSIVASACLPLAALALREPGEIIALGVVVGLFAIWKHKENISRIVAGTEPRFGEKV